MYQKRDNKNFPQYNLVLTSSGMDGYIFPKENDLRRAFSLQPVNPKTHTSFWGPHNADNGSYLACEHITTKVSNKVLRSRFLYLCLQRKHKVVEPVLSQPKRKRPNPMVRIRSFLADSEQPQLNHLQKPE